MPGTLYVVATPIGNLGDLSDRARRILASVAVVACEDTRVTGKLLHHFGIEARMVSYHEHNEARRAEELLGRLKGGEDVALVSDAGTPLVSDPGYRLVAAARESDIAVRRPRPSPLQAFSPDAEPIENAPSNRSGTYLIRSCSSKRQRGRRGSFRSWRAPSAQDPRFC
jgi:16S rRNA (cytidine1402-2'-O)-methyltransferase